MNIQTTPFYDENTCTPTMRELVKLLETKGIQIKVGNLNWPHKHKCKIATLNGSVLTLNYSLIDLFALRFNTVDKEIM